MSGSIDPRRVPGNRLRLIGLSLFDRATFERYLAPAIADLQADAAESRQDEGPAGRLRASWRAYWAVLRTMADCLFVRRATSFNHGVLVRAAAILVLLTAALIGFPASSYLSRFINRFGLAEAPSLIALLLPSTLAITVPLTVLVVGLLRSTWRTRNEEAMHTPAGVVRSMLALSVITATLSLTLVMWLVPAANQAYRERMWAYFSDRAAYAPVLKGDNEMTLSELRNAAGDPQLGASARARSSYSYQVRLAMAAANLAFAFLALALGGRMHARGRRPLATAGSVVAVFVVYGLALMAGRRLAQGLVVPGWLCAWAPNIMVTVLALVMVSHAIARLTDRPNSGDAPPGEGHPRSLTAGT
jgi:lipopolysaccharide export LptBFGC system permease protein LptF